MNRMKYGGVMQIIFYIILLFCFCINQHLFAQTKVIEPISRVFYGNSKVNCTDGKYCYIGAGGTVIIGEIVSADSVSLLSECYLPSMIEDLIIHDEILYVSDLLTGLHIIDVKDVLQPHEIGRLDFPYRSYGITIDSTNLFIAHRNNGVTKVDISNRSNPISLITAKFPCTKLRIHSKYLYCINWDNITIASVTTLDSLNAFPVYNKYFGEIIGIEFSNNIGILVQNFQGIENSLGSILDLLDLSNPLSPKKLSSLDLPFLYTFTSKGNTVLCFTHDSLYSVNINSAISPFIVSKIPDITGDYVSVKNSLLLISRNYRSDFQLIDINDISRPKIGFHLSTLADIGSIAVTDSFLVAGRFDNSGMIIADIKDITKPVIKYEYKEETGSIRGIKIINGRIYVTTEFQGLKIFDLENSYQLKLIGEMNYIDWLMAIDVLDTLAACGGSYYDVSLISVADPANPKYISKITMPPSMVVEGIHLKDSLLIINGDYGGVKIYDISSTVSPSLLWEKYYNSCEAVCISDNILFVSDFSTIHAFDITQPSNPEELGSFQLDRRITGLSVKDSIAFVSVFSNGYYADNGMVILDVRNCDSINEVARANTPQYSNSIFATDKYIFLADNEDGLYIYDWNRIITNVSTLADNSIPSGYKLFQNYPNPFNPTTTIKYSLEKTGYVNLSVYDILGKKIVTLVNETQNAGIHKVNFNASELSSGVYIYRIEAGLFTQSQKMMLLK